MKVIRALWWLAFLASLVILVGSLPGYWANMNRGDLAAELADVQRAALWIGAVLSVASAVLCLALAVLLFVKKQNDGMALFLSFYLLLYGSLIGGPLEHFMPFWLQQSEQLAFWLQGVFMPLPTIVLILVFPNGRFIPRWTRWLVVVTGLATLFAFFSIASYVELVRFDTPSAQVAYAVFGIAFLVAFGVQFYRYFRLYTPLERQQAKWVVYGLVVSYIFLALVSIPYYYVQNLPPGSPIPWWVPLGSLGWWLGLMLQPVAFTIAILRARLWDIDVIVRRTLLYALVTLTLALIYFASVVLLQRVFTELTGVEQNEIVNVLSTLAIAALFIPVRNRTQNAIDRYFNRQKYDAQKVLQDFAETVRDETDLEKLTARLVEVVQETMEPRSVSVWLKRESERDL